MVLSGTEILRATGATIEPSPGVVTQAPPDSASITFITGSVNGATGAITAGTGFTVTHPSTGSYVITLPSPTFSAAPVVVGTVIQSSGSSRILSISSVTSTGFGVQTTSDAGVGVDQNFNFIAVGMK